MKLINLTEFFENSIFRIPNYQRGYSWYNTKKDESGNLFDLWNDINNLTDNEWHYTGMVTLSEISQDKKDNSALLKGKNQYYIVDGQQRITSIVIILSVINEYTQKLETESNLREVKDKFLFTESGITKSVVFGYETDNPSDEFFRENILKIKDNSTSKPESIYTKNIEDAQQYFKRKIEEKIKNDEEKNYLNDLYNKITKQLKFIKFILPNKLNEYVVFETMNNRGKPLSELEKLKNRILFLNDKLSLILNENEICSEKSDLNSQKLIDQRNEITELTNKAWITIYKSLGKNIDSPLDDEEFLHTHWILYFKGYSRDEANVYKNFLFNEYFNINNVINNKITAKDVVYYIKSLEKASIYWYKINGIKDIENNELEKSLAEIHAVGFNSSLKPLILSIFMREDKDRFTKCLNLLEEFSFKIFDISKRRATTGNSKLFELAYKIKENELTHFQLEIELKNIISSYYNFSIFKGHIEDLFKSEYQDGFYSWSGVKYFLYKYDKHLRENNNNNNFDNRINIKRLKEKNSLEHILPNSMLKSFEEFKKGYSKKSEEEIEKRYNKLHNDWKHFDNFDNNKLKRLVQNIGNFLLLSNSENSSKGNESFKVKKDQLSKGEKYKNKGYKYDSMSAVLVSNNEKWESEEILNRGMKMINFLLNILLEGEKLAEEEKIKLLGLDFLKTDNSISE